MFRSITIFVLAIVAAVAGIFFFAPVENKSNDTNVPAVKINAPVDLNGKWKSDKPAFEAEVKNGTIEVSMVLVEGYSRFWYGTFDNPQPGTNEVVSKGIDEPGKFYLSSAETKNFLYQNGKLVVDFSVMGTTTAVAMSRA